MNSWQNEWYHNEKGLILGSVKEYNGAFKALLDNVFIGWFVSESYARKAVEDAYRDSPKSTRIN